MAFRRTQGHVPQAVGVATGLDEFGDGGRLGQQSLDGSQGRGLRW